MGKFADLFSLFKLFQVRNFSPFMGNLTDFQLLDFGPQILPTLLWYPVDSANGVLPNGVLWNGVLPKNPNAVFGGTPFRRTPFRLNA
jgi:hypothetical protein